MTKWSKRGVDLELDLLVNCRVAKMSKFPTGLDKLVLEGEPLTHNIKLLTEKA
jgi:hypothetical protein